MKLPRNIKESCYSNTYNFSPSEITTFDLKTYEQKLKKNKETQRFKLQKSRNT